VLVVYVTAYSPVCRVVPNIRYQFGTRSSTGYRNTELVRYDTLILTLGRIGKLVCTGRVVLKNWTNGVIKEFANA